MERPNPCTGPQVWLIFGTSLSKILKAVDNPPKQSLLVVPTPFISFAYFCMEWRPILIQFIHAPPSLLVGAAPWALPLNCIRDMGSRSCLELSYMDVTEVAPEPYERNLKRSGVIVPILGYDPDVVEMYKDFI
ncbi:hypothetical protein VNO77_37670 [Canavalia gladiata]|uniref:Uncharacterized protein n=1 Tax=Canavalia gladiata TaxID=3824 RepID=A0AAN9K952_CANGL